MLWIAILAAAIAGNAGIALTQVLLSGMSQFLHFDDRRLGDLASAASIGSSLMIVASMFFMDRKGRPLRSIAIISLGMYAAVNLTIPTFFANTTLLQTAIFVGGCFSGLIWSAAATALTTVRNNERLTAIFYGTPYITGLLVPPLIPFIFARWGLASAYIGIAGACLVALFVVRAFPLFAAGASSPDVATSVAGGGRRRGSSPTAVVIVLAALFIQYCANSGLWVYFDRIGHVSGHDPQASANVIALGAGTALVGTMLAAISTSRLSPSFAIAIGSAIMAVSSLGLLQADNYVIYAASVSLINVMVTFITPYFLIMLGRISAAPGRAALAANSCMMAGFALGPLIVSRMVVGGDFTTAILCASAAMLLSGLIVMAGKGRRSDARPRDEVARGEIP